MEVKKSFGRGSERQDNVSLHDVSISPLWRLVSLWHQMISTFRTEKKIPQRVQCDLKSWACTVKGFHWVNSSFLVKESFHWDKVIKNNLWLCKNENRLKNWRWALKGSVCWLQRKWKDLGFPPRPEEPFQNKNSTRIGTWLCHHLKETT